MSSNVIGLPGIQIVPLDDLLLNKHIYEGELGSCQITRRRRKCFSLLQVLTHHLDFRQGH